MNEAKIIILGLDGAGKTAIYNKLRGADIDYKELKATTGFNTVKVQYDGDKNLTMDLWEIGGAKTIRSFWKNYSSNKDGLIYVIDSTDSGRLDETTKELKKLVKEKSLSEVPILVIASKQDKDGALLPNDIKKSLMADPAFQSRSSPLLVEGSSIEGSFKLSHLTLKRLIEEIRKQKEHRNATDEIQIQVEVAKY